MPLDTIILRHLHTTATIGPDAWNRPGKPQPIILTLKLRVDTAPAGNSDDIGQTFSYGQMCKDIAQVSNGFYLSIDNLTRHLLKITDDHGWPGEGLEISALAPKALLRVEGGLQRELVLQRTYEEEEWQIERHVWLVKDLKVACIIGVNPHERLEKQQVNINLRVTVDGDQNDQAQHILKDSGVWRKLVNKVCEIVEPSSFRTLEALAALIARSCLQTFPIPKITVAIEKPSALTFVEGAGVEITRERNSLTS